ncbi:MAG: IPT/TIG domain-containing protein, partial [Myxococcota bacterium]
NTMIRHLKLLLLAFVLLPVASQSAPPVVPDLLSYQGVLLDDLGVPRTGSVDLTLRIWDAPFSGSLIYAQTFSGVPLSDGVFTVALGPAGAATDPPNPPPLSTDLSEAVAGDLSGTSASRFLEVTVGTEGALTRTQILTVPYALRAEQAAQAELAAVATTALSAADATSVGGLPAEVVTEIFEHTNLDGSGPPNADPSEGLGDTDLDGIANFVDSDNDNDGLDDSTEVGQGTDINLITPSVLTVSPPTGNFSEIQTVTVTGTEFQPGIGVIFGAESPTPTSVTTQSFDVSVGPQTAGFVDVFVTRINGETGTLANAFEFIGTELGTHSVPALADTQLSLGVIGPRTAIGGRHAYQFDSDSDGSPDVTVLFGSNNVALGQIAVGFTPGGDLFGLRCRFTTGVGCDIELTTDTDADFDLNDETPVLIESLATTGSSKFITAPSVSFDPSGRPVAGYVKPVVGSTNATVAHDRDGDGAFTGTNEIVEVGTFIGTLNLGEVAASPTGEVAFVYWDNANGEIDVAWDRNGDGDFTDTVGGNPEQFILASGATPTCVGAGFAPDGDLSVIYDQGAGATFARDLNQDGDFDDGGEISVVAGSTGPACDLVGGGPTLTAGFVTQAGSVRMLLDLNDDGDFDEAGENVELATSIGVERLVLAENGAGSFFMATSGAPANDLILIDPIP